MGWTDDDKARDTYNFFIYSKIFDERNKNLEQSYVNFIELDDCKSSASIPTVPTNYKDSSSRRSIDPIFLSVFPRS